MIDHLYCWLLERRCASRYRNMAALRLQLRLSLSRPIDTRNAEKFSSDSSCSKHKTHTTRTPKTGHIGVMSIAQQAQGIVINVLYQLPENERLRFQQRVCRRDAWSRARDLLLLQVEGVECLFVLAMGWRLLFPR